MEIPPRQFAGQIAHFKNVRIECPAFFEKTSVEGIIIPKKLLADKASDLRAVVLLSNRVNGLIERELSCVLCAFLCFHSHNQEGFLCQQGSFSLTTVHLGMLWVYKLRM